MSMQAKRLLASAVAGALLVAAAACADRATAPAPTSSAAANNAPSQGIDYALGGRAVSPLRLDMAIADPVVFTVDPTRSSYYQLAGGHFLYVPAYAICDPSTTAYGPSHWDEPCTPATRPVQITAVSMQNVFGMPYVDFQPALRFAPSRYPQKWVWLFMYDSHAAENANVEIDYCFTGLSCVDESALDATLVTHLSSSGTYLYRRVKHFSGYNVAAGYSQPDSTSSLAY